MNGEKHMIFFITLICFLIFPTLAFASSEGTSTLIKGVENDVCYFNINYINSIIYIEKTSV